MSRRDDFHFSVRRALEKEGWTITHDPLKLVFQDIKLEADLGAERLFAAEKEGRKIAVEIKDFDATSATNELENRHFILFHAQLIDGKVIIEADMTEGLKPLLIEAGIREEDFLSDRDRDRVEAEQVAA